MSKNYKVCNSRICPRCGRPYTDPPALSRVDSKTEICPMCGMDEALQEMTTATREPKKKEKKYFPYWGEPPVDQDEYIKHKLSVQNGSRIFTGITRAEMLDILKDHGISVKRTASWELMFERLMALVEDEKFELSLVDLAKKKGIGVNAQHYVSMFDVAESDVKRLAKFGLLEIVGHDHFRMYGRECTAPLYNIDQYENMTAELMQDLLYRCPKGCRKLREGRIRF